MARLRIVFVLLALGLMIPGVLLVRRALESVLVERAVRHRTVAERIFDEMERSLSSFLAAEEERPVGHYHYAWSPPGSPATVLLRSPLADPPDRRFVVGHFEVDGLGRIRTPLRPEPDEASGDWPAPSEKARAAADRLLQLATQAWPAPPELRKPEQKPGTTVAVGRTARLDESLRKDAQPREREVLADAYDALQSLNRGAELRSKRSQKVVVLKPGSYGAPELVPADPGVVESARDAAARGAAGIELAAEARSPLHAGSPADSASVDAERPHGSSPIGSSGIGSAQSDSARIGSGFDGDEAFLEEETDLRQGERVESEARRFEHAAQPRVARRPETQEGSPRSLGIPSETAKQELRSDLAAPPQERKLEDARAKKEQSAPSSDVKVARPASEIARSKPNAETMVPPPARSAASPEWIVDPMLGFALDGQHLVLHRTVWRGQKAIRQGLIVDVGALEGELLGAVLPAGAFPGAVARIRPSDAPTPALAIGETEVFHYRHRFAEPFDALRIDLELPELQGASGAGTIYLLSLALLLAGSIGLFALYRMVGVVVGFSERRSNFVAAVSHELKTPLTAIRMYAEMLRDGMVSGEDRRKEYYGTITAESERLSRLIDNVLEFSRLEKGTREISWVVGDLGSLVSDAIGVLSPHAEAQGFRLQSEIAEDLPAVRFDRDAVMQVLFNLVDNALKYARDARDKRIVVTCRREGDGVELAVCDSGPGVAGEHMKKMFEPFYRGESELTRRAQGTGIGLSLVKGLAEQMNAALQASNRPEGGLQVSLRFQPTR